MTKPDPPVSPAVPQKKIGESLGLSENILVSPAVERPSEPIKALIAKWRELGDSLLREYGEAGVMAARAKQWHSAANQLELALSAGETPSQPYAVGEETIGETPALSAHDHGNCELCDAIEVKLAALTAERSRLLTMRDYVRHKVDCWWHNPGAKQSDCTCGLQAVLDLLADGRDK